MKGRICDLYNGLDVGMNVSVETGGRFFSKTLQGKIVSKTSHPYHIITIQSFDCMSSMDFTSSNTNQIEIL